MSAVPAVDGRNVTWQEALSAAELERMQVVELRDPVAEPEDAKLTVPVGGMGPALVSMTIAAQVEAWFANTSISQETVVMVGSVTVMPTLSELGVWLVSPG